MNILRETAKRLIYKNWGGHCPVCKKAVRFYAKGDWYRDQLFCGGCGSVPRERALMRVIDSLYPNWRELSIHESSPGRRGASLVLQAECPRYVASQFIPGLEPGERHPDGYVIQNLEMQTFEDQTFDIVITQDVFEHIFHPDLAIKEIVRTLRPGGSYIMTVPIVNKYKPSFRRASLVDGNIISHAPDQYHGNPVGDGSLVTIDWGYDIGDYLNFHSGMTTSIFNICDMSAGICAEYIDVVVTRNMEIPMLN